jgi:hypothetical protein
MRDFRPALYVNEDAEILWQPQLPDGTRLYYNHQGDMVVTTPDLADISDYRPLVTSSYRHAIKTAKIAHKDRKDA